MIDYRIRETPGFSMPIDMRKLEHETRRLLWYGVLFAVAFHVFLGVFVHYRSPASLAVMSTPVKDRVMKMDLIEIPLDSANPYDTWRGPEQQPARYRKAFRTAVPSVPYGSLKFKRPPGFGAESAFHFRSDEFGVDVDALIRAVVRGGAVQLAKRIKDPEFTPPPKSPEFKLRRDPSVASNRISMKDEMLRVEDLSTGKYKGLVVVNLANERDLKGYLSIPSTLSGERLRTPSETARAAAGLVGALQRFTGIIARPDSMMTLTSPTFPQFPFVYISADDLFDLSIAERISLGNYLRNGGFAFIEAFGGNRPDLPLKGSGPLRKMLLDALGAEGNLRPLPADHYLYHCYFDFTDGPPRTKRDETGKQAGQAAGVLEGIWIGDRLAAVYSEKGYGRAWSSPGGPEEYLRMGINIVVYALTQAGGLTLRLVDDSGK